MRDISKFFFKKFAYPVFFAILCYNQARCSVHAQYALSSACTSLYIIFHHDRISSR